MWVNMQLFVLLYTVLLLKSMVTAWYVFVFLKTEKFYFRHVNNFLSLKQ